MGHDNLTLRAELLLQLERVRQMTLRPPPLEPKELLAGVRDEIAALLGRTDPTPRGPFTSHRGHRKGRAISALKKALALPTRPYNRFLLQGQAAFNDRLVRLVEQLAERLGQVAEGTRVLSERVEYWGNDLQRGREERLAVLEGLEALGQRLDALEGRTARMEGQQQGLSQEARFALEARLRGSEEDTRARLRGHLSHFRGVAGPVLDVGCGRGEWLELLKAAGLSASGVDLNPRMVEHCDHKGLQVRQGELLESLEALEPRSLAGLSALRVLEQLTPSELERFLRLAFERLRPGGVLLLEALDPRCLPALQAALATPTHRTLLSPEMLAWQVERAGFEGVRTQGGPSPEASARRALPPYPEALGQALERLQALLDGPGDFWLTARRPGGAG